MKLTFTIIVISIFIFFLVIQYMNNSQLDSTQSNNYEVATLASGCFWCMEAIMQETEGIIDAISGYAGGQEENPTYEDVYSELTGHRETVQVTFDPKEITYEKVLMIFWQNIDPTDAGGQFVDRGFSYTTAIFYHNKSQKEIAQKTKEDLENSNRFDKPIVTEIIPFTTFYKAEEYHQDFYKKSSSRYLGYSEASGRKEFKEKIWEEIQKNNK